MERCAFCTTNTEKFISSTGKEIYMCPCCGYLYLPINTRNKRVQIYKCNKATLYLLEMIYQHTNKLTIYNHWQMN